MAIEESNLDKLRRIIKQSIGHAYESWTKQTSQDFGEDDKHKGQFHKLYDGYGASGNFYENTYARFHTTEGISLVHNATVFNSDGTITSNTQSITLSPEEFEESIFAYLNWEEGNKYDS